MRIVPLAVFCLAGCEKPAATPEQGAEAQANSAKAEGAPKAIFGLRTAPMEQCAGGGTPGPIQAVVTMALTRDLDLTVRRVKSRRTNTSDDEDNSGTDNNPPNGRGNPFHIYMKGSYPATPPTTGFLRVRIVLPRNSQWNFFNEGTDLDDPGQIHGAGVSGLMPGDTTSTTPGEADIICSNSIRRIGTSANNKEIAIFYIDLAKYRQYWGTANIAIPFNIIVWRDGQQDTPIIIDPKIRNDGSQ